MIVIIINIYSAFKKEKERNKGKEKKMYSQFDLRKLSL